MRRRNFAASMVVTVSLAELACTGSSGMIQQNPPPPRTGGEGPEQTPDEKPPAPPDEKPPVVKPPTPDEKPPRPDDKQFESTATIELQPNGSCLEIVNVECPENVKCNPPPPRTVDCPDDLLPAATNPAAVTLRDDGSCWQNSAPPKCPKGAICNPPPPRRVQCPESVFPEAEAGSTVFTKDDGSCWEAFDVKCNEGETCNPPPPRRVQCKPKKPKPPISRNPPPPSR